MMSGTFGKLSENLVGHAQAENYCGQRRLDGLNSDREEQCSREDVRVTWFDRNALFASRMAVTILERVMSACNLPLPQNWKIRSNRRLLDLKNAKSREAVMDASQRWFRGNGISMRGVTDEGLFASFSIAMSCELNFSIAMSCELKLASSRHGVSRKWYDFLRPDLPSLSAYLSVGRQLVWDKECLSSLNRLRGKTGQADGGSVIAEWGGPAGSPIDLIVCDSDLDGTRLIQAFSSGRLVSDIDPEVLQEAATYADEAVGALDAPGLAQTDQSEDSFEQLIVQELQSTTLKIGTAYRDAIENWQPYYDENGNILAADPLTRVAQLSQSWEFDAQTETLTVCQTSQLSDQDAIDQFFQQLIVDASGQQWQGISPTDMASDIMTPTYNLGGAHFNSMYATDNSLYYSILELQQTQQSMAAFAIANQNWQASVPLLDWGRQQLIEQGRATDLLDERLALYNKALQVAYFNMMLCLMHLGHVNALRADILQPNFLPVEDFSMGIHLNMASGMFIMDNENAIWDDRFGRI